MAGFSDTSTRSGMLWEVERILKECKDKPDVLLMENVPLIHSQDNIGDFNKWIQSLESMGYKNYWQDLIATDYGIPQTRNRTFMVSVLGNYKYTFPEPIPLKLKLKDMLEDNVDEKYYLSDKQINCLSSQKEYDNGYIRGEQFKKNINPTVATTLTASSSDRASDTFIAIKNATSKGYLEAEEGDGVVVNNLRIRKLTPRECGRLMGVKDEDITKILKHQSNASAYHLFGDSIVCDVLVYVFKNMMED